MTTKEEALTTSRRGFVGGVSAAALLTATRSAVAQKKYDDGATDKEIKIGHFCPYSGPASAYGVIGQAHQVYWKAVNEAGGINGRKVVFVTLDDGYSPPKSVEVTRQLVEQEKVLCLFNTLGTPTNTAIHKYVNQKKVPHLFVSTGASKWGKPREFPWTMGFQPISVALRIDCAANFGVEMLKKTLAPESFIWMTWLSTVGSVTS